MAEGAECIWYLFEDGAHSAADNMAIDEALLMSCATLGAPVLRCYSWSEPAASFGYFQRYADVERMTALRPLVRRPTGGGLVSHDADWTYSLVFPPQHEWYRLKAIESYRRLHDWVRRAFTECGVVAEIAAVASKSAPGQCFAGPDQFDVMWRGRKLAGAAQRRSRNGLLIQGSVQPPTGVERKQWQAAMCGIAEDNWNHRWKMFDPTSVFEGQVNALYAKYASIEYNQRR